jgi:hypothetical protein
MTGFNNYYGRNPFPDDGPYTLDFYGYTYLGPVMIPPVPTTVGMQDRGGSGVYWFLMWDGQDHLVLTNAPPMAFPQWTAAGLSVPFPQNAAIFGPYDGPYIGQTGWRLGVLDIAGVPHLQADAPDPTQTQLYTTLGFPVVAPDLFGPQTQSYPEPSNYPAPGVPTVPGIPSSTPVPTGGGFAAFEAAYATNTPPLILPAAIPRWSQLGPSAQPWHLQHYGA